MLSSRSGPAALRAPAYLRATPLPHATATAAFSLFIALACLAVRSWNNGPGPLCLLLGLLAAGFLNAVLFSLADGYNRFREYQRLRDLLARHGCRPLILRAGSSSRCQRDAALAAAREAGVREEALHYFRSQGYRWYHLLPDGFSSDPLFLIRPHFLKATLIPRRRAAPKSALAGTRSLNTVTE